MIGTRLWNKIFHFTLTASLHYLAWYCAANINISYKSTEHLSKPNIRSLWVSSYGVLEMITIRTNKCLTPFTPLAPSCIDNVLIRRAPELNRRYDW